MGIETICSGCGKRLSVSEEHAGKRARCPACGQIYAVPFPGDAAPDPTQAAEAAGPSALPPRSVDPRLVETIAGPDGWREPPAAAVSEPLEQFWMRTVDGTQYGPVERTKLNRWFNEGRVGPGYQVRVGEFGPWQPAESFQPQTRQGASPSGALEAAASQGNPYADNYPYRPTSAASTGGYQKGDPSGVVLTMGVLAWVCLLVCWPIGWVPGLVAWIAGSSALKDIQAGIADPSNRTLVQVGYYLGMANVLLLLLALLAMVAFFFLAAFAQNF